MTIRLVAVPRILPPESEGMAVMLASQVVEGLSPERLAVMVSQGESLWASIPTWRRTLLVGFAGPVMPHVGMLSAPAAEQALGMTRPDLVPVVATEAGRSWLADQVEEIKAELTQGEQP